MTETAASAEAVVQNLGRERHYKPGAGEKMKVLFFIVLFVALASAQYGGWPARTPSITSVDITDSTVTIYYRQSSGTFYPEGGHPPDAIWKDIYKVRKGRLIKDTTLTATVEESYTVPEKVHW